ncbi:MAG: ABC transporter ATP-binding protein [Proteobacteria bacterium]|nr:ABC transporter ATP-binding protein [Pseudomonadota bacterium]
MNALEITNLSLKSGELTILEDINLSLEENSFLGLIGPNGAGKTVLLKCILGLIKPTAGEVKIFGKNIKEARGSYSHVPQYAEFDSSFPIKVKEVVLMGRMKKAGLCRNYSIEDKAKVNESLVKLEIEDLAEKQIKNLSGGQLQRVLIARALASEPRLLLLDEPTASLDSRVGKDVYQILSELSAHMTIILVSHDIGAISSHVKTIACLNKKLHYHNDKNISSEVIQEVYGCPFELLAHGHAHRVLDHHHKD